jgi:hypothetical protein
MASPIPNPNPNPNPNRDFVLGVVYAAIELDDVLNRENGMFGDCEIVRRPDGKANVIYRATFPLPTRTQEQIARVLKTHAQVVDVIFGDIPIQRR